MNCSRIVWVAGVLSLSSMLGCSGHYEVGVMPSAGGAAPTAGSGKAGTAPELPALTTREWASEQAQLALASVSAANPAGMTRFLDAWLPKNGKGALWASIVASSSGTLNDLLTTGAALPHGAGVLTDPVLLEQPTLAERGAYLQANLLCSPPPATPPGIPPLDSSGSRSPGETRRMHFMGVPPVSCRSATQRTPSSISASI